MKQVIKKIVQLLTDNLTKDEWKQVVKANFDGAYIEEAIDRASIEILGDEEYNKLIEFFQYQ